jgi:transcriptional regulator with XRE-family HTH domain
MATKGRGKRGHRGAEPELVRLGPIDKHVGGRVKLRRRMLGLSQQKLAGALGVTFQQLQKNERGTNRIASSRLFDLSRALDVPIQYFFDEMSPEVVASVRQRGGTVKSVAPVEPGAFARRETHELVRAYYRIKSPSVRKRIYGLAQTLAGDLD